jgi:hypothetical protein
MDSLGSPRRIKPSKLGTLRCASVSLAQRTKRGARFVRWRARAESVRSASLGLFTLGSRRPQHRRAGSDFACDLQALVPP